MISGNALSRMLAERIEGLDEKGVSKVIEESGDGFSSLCSSMEDMDWERVVDAFKSVVGKNSFLSAKVKVSADQGPVQLKSIVCLLSAAGGWRMLAREDANFESPLSVLLNLGCFWVFDAVFSNEAELSEFVKENEETLSSLICCLLGSGNANRLKIAEKLFLFGLPVDVSDPSTNVPLFEMVVEKDDSGFAELLVKNGFDPFSEKQGSAFLLAKEKSGKAEKVLESFLSSATEKGVTIPSWARG